MTRAASIIQTGHAVVEANGWLGTMHIGRIDRNGSFKGTAWADPIEGRWDAAARRIDFVRRIRGDYLQYYTGVEDAALLFRGTFVEETGGVRSAQVHHWVGSPVLHVVGNGHVGRIEALAISADGSATGLIYGEPLQGQWDQGAQTLTFVRGSPGPYRQHWQGTKGSGLGFVGSFREEVDGQIRAERYAWTAKEQQRVTAFVLSGGGSRGDFQLGVLQALYDRGLRPQLVVGTSVGSVNGICLMQGESGIDRLKQLWFGLGGPESMWSLEPWWDSCDPAYKSIAKAIALGQPLPPEVSIEGLEAIGLRAGGGALGGLVAAGPWGAVFGGVVGAASSPASGAIAGLPRLFTALTSEARALFNLNPIRAMLSQQLDHHLVDQWVAAGNRARFCAVSLESGRLGYVTERGHLVGRPEIANSTAGTPGVSLADGVLASATIAGVFPPLEIAGQHWVDGGHRDNVPIDAALECGATEVFAVCCSPVARDSTVNQLPTGTDAPNYARAGVLSIVGRTLLGIHLDEMASNDVFRYDASGGQQVTVISPAFPLHDILEIDPELIRASYDYGYCTTADMLDNAVPEAREATETIRRARTMLHYQLKGRIRTDYDFGRFRAEVLGNVQRRRDLGAPSPLNSTYEWLGEQASGSALRAGQVLAPDAPLRSPNGLFEFVYQGEGNLVLYGHAAGQRQVVWASGTDGYQGCCLLTQQGNFVIFGANGRAIWSSNTNAPRYHEAIELRVLDDGAVVLVQGADEFWRLRPAAQVPRAIRVSNHTEQAPVVRFYKADDPHRLATLPAGEVQLAPLGTLVFSVPADVSRVVITFDRRNEQTASPGDTVVFATDDRVRIRNLTGREVKVRFYDPNDSVVGTVFDFAAVPIDGQEHTLVAHSELRWQLPAHLDRIKAVFNRVHVQTMARGAEFDFNTQDERILLRNRTGESVEVLIWKSDDPIMYVFGQPTVLPGGRFTLPPHGDYYYTVPGDVRSVKLKAGGGPMVFANRGDLLFYEGGGNVSTNP